MTITCVLICEGNSDLCIQRFVEELLHPDIQFEFQPGRGVRLPNPPKSTLWDKVQNARRLYAPDLLLIHRDADRAGFKKRVEEVQEACSNCIPVIPVREIEAWLLADRKAILKLTKLSSIPAKAKYPRDVESINAKKCLEHVLRECRLAKNWKPKDFQFGDDRAQLSRLVSDLDRLRQLKSFQQFEEALNNAITNLRS